MKLTHLLLALITTTVTQAAEATFSADGLSVYLLPLDAATTVHVITPATKKHRTINALPASEKSPITALARDATGGILLTTDRALWNWNGQAGQAKKIVDLPKHFVVEDLSCFTGQAPAGAGTIFLHGRNKDAPRATLLTLVKATNQWHEVFCRRNDPHSAPRCNAAGRTFFASDHDLWEGNFLREADTPQQGEIAGSVEGCRIAPLAMMNTDSGNSGAMVVQLTAPAGNQLFTLLGGRHMGAILRTPAPPQALYPAAASNEHPELDVQWKLMQRSLANTQILYQGGPCDALAVHESAKGEIQVFWRQDLESERAWMLVKNEGKPQKIGTDPQ
jgi:hypothetical protein